MPRVVKSPQERRAEFIAAANALFFSKGYANTSVNDLIQHVGVSKGAFYHHFDSKQAVLEAWSDDMLEQYRQVIGGLVEDPNLNALTKWETLLRRTNQWEIGQKDIMLGFFKIINMDENLQLKHNFMQKVSALLAGYYEVILCQGNQEKVFDAPSTTVTARLMVSVLNGFSEELTRKMLNTDKMSDLLDEVVVEVKATQLVLERMVGAKPGSMPLINDQLLHAWFTE
ncbi:TetR/AcrR family transcriptional regulator [Photobacterium rosenbergii]|uniref:TetR/AcrR family transcriptional regulator n=1 Tax=Photobacterium rosenbergii TaxID=294936 RepID=A0ABU3ZGS7_9GAMM|nr:TetR/AcrR family transcriptional regulator [Photobacterium rosenbergii]MDV5169320.1 TetR/AcrR family transcriptional regulator [Photobacterium rosenbergii]